MKTIRNLLAAGVLALAVAFTLPASAQTYGRSTATLIPAIHTGATNLATLTAIDARYQDKLAIVGTTAGPSIQTNTIAAVRSLDGTLTYADTNNPVSIVLFSAGSGVKKVSATNITMNGFGYLIIRSVTPTDTTIATSNTLNYAVKPEGH